MTRFFYIEGDEGDLDRVAPLWEKLNEHHQVNSTVFARQFALYPFSRRKAALLAKAAEGALLVVLAIDGGDERPAGYCIASVSAAGEGEIESIFVEESCRGLGVGDRLMRTALQWMDRNCARTKRIGVAEGSENVFSFYRRYGFMPRVTILEQVTDPR